MTIDENMEFMFYTRTLSEDYRLFVGDGSESGNYAKFRQIEYMAQVESDEEASAILYKGVGRYCLAVFNLSRGVKDRSGRDSRFSFWVSFNGIGIKEKGYAMRAFACVRNDWKGVGEFVYECLREEHKTRKYEMVVDEFDEKTKETKQVKKIKRVPGEDVRFDYKKFIGELVSDPVTLESDEVKGIEKGKMLKYFERRDDTKIISIKDEEEDSGDPYTGRMKMKRKFELWILGILLVGVVIGIGSVMWYLMPGKSPSKPPEVPSKLQDEQLNQPEKSSEKSQNGTDNKKEEEENGRLNNVSSNDRVCVSTAKEIDRRIGQPQRGDDTVRSNDRNSNNEDQGGDDNRE